MAVGTAFGVRVPAIPQLRDFRFPIGELNPNARENVVVGRRAYGEKDYREHRNVAIASIASAAIMLVAATIATSLALSFLITAFSTSALVLAALGGAYFITMRLLDPKEKIDYLREKLRDAPLQAVLKQSTYELEGYDLLGRAIEDRTADPRAKETIYLCLRQLKRNFHQLQEIKEEHYRLVNMAFNNYFCDAHDARKRIVRAINHLRTSDRQRANYHQTLEANYSQSILDAAKEKSRAYQRVDDAYYNAVNGLEKKYQGLLNGYAPKYGLAKAWQIGSNGVKAVGWVAKSAFDWGKWVYNEF